MLSRIANLLSFLYLNVAPPRDMFAPFQQHKKQKQNNNLTKKTNRQSKREN